MGDRGPAAWFCVVVCDGEEPRPRPGWERQLDSERADQNGGRRQALCRDSDKTGEAGVRRLRTPTEVAPQPQARRRSSMNEYSQERGVEEGRCQTAVDGTQCGGEKGNDTSLVPGPLHRRYWPRRPVECEARPGDRDRQRGAEVHPETEVQ